MTSITWAAPRCVQELGTFLGPQNRTQGRCEIQYAECQNTATVGFVNIEYIVQQIDFYALLSSWIQCNSFIVM